MNSSFPTTAQIQKNVAKDNRKPYFPLPQNHFREQKFTNLSVCLSVSLSLSLTHTPITTTITAAAATAPSPPQHTYTGQEQQQHSRWKKQKTNEGMLTVPKQ